MEAEIKRDADFIISRLQIVLANIEILTETLERRGDRLFGCTNNTTKQIEAIPRDNMSVLDLLEQLDIEMMKLLSQSNRF